MRSLAVAALLASIVSPPARAASETSLRCAGGIVAVGDATIDVLGKCGAPTLREPLVDQTAVSARARSGLRSSIVVTVERWTYDFGSQQFLMFVTVENGRVTRIERGGYGYAGGATLAVPLRRATCDPSTLRVGDAKIDLLARCGEPALVDARPAFERQVPVDVGVGYYVARPVAVVLEVWTYDFGPQAFVRIVSLENGVVTQVETGSYGYAR